MRRLRNLLPWDKTRDSADPGQGETTQAEQEDVAAAEGQDSAPSAAREKQILAGVRAGLMAASRKTWRRVSTVGESVRETSADVSENVKASARRAASSSTEALDKVADWAVQRVELREGLLATYLSNDLNRLMEDAVDGAPTIYDQAMDAAYNATNQGGAQHRLFDGGHTIAGAVTAGHSASADDGIVQEALGTVLGLLRDGTTSMGLPIVTWNEATFDSVATALQSHLDIPRRWFYDLNTYDAAELLGGTIGTVALALNWNRADTEAFARLAGSLGLSSVAAANPVLLVVTVVALAKAFHEAHRTGDYGAFIDGQAKGLVGTGSTLAAISLVGVAGGPTGVALLAGLTAGVLASRATRNVSLTQVSTVVAKNAQTAALEVRDAASRGIAKGSRQASTA